MSLVQMHQSACASCRLRSLIAAKQYARCRIPLSARVAQGTSIGTIRRLHASPSSREDGYGRTFQSVNNDIIRKLEDELESLDKKLATERVAAQAEHDFELAAPDLPLPRSLHEAQDVDFEWSPEASLSPEDVARQARQQFGDELPEDILDESEYKAYERLFGAPIRFTRPGEEEDDVMEYEADEMDERVDVGTGILKEGKEGLLEEVEFIEDEEEPAEETVENEEDDLLETPARNDFEGLDKKTLSDLAALQVEDAGQAETDSGYAAFMRTHPFTAANRFTTPSSTVQLPKPSFVDPVSILLSGLPPSHVSDAAHRIFGGPGLPYSTSTPRRGLTMPQKSIPLDPYQGRMSEMDADVYTATIMPGVYASAYSIMVETRKRLGSSWLERLLTKEDGPRILDAGGAGAAILAAREVLRAEWERMHDTSDDPASVMDVAEASGKTGGESISAPVGRATVLAGSDSLRQRASTLLDNTTFLPRLPDYVHASDEEARERGKFDIIFAPHTLWQLKEEYLRKQHIANLWSLLSSDGGVLVLFEKGVPRGFELVAGAREMLLDTRLASPGKEDISEDIYSVPDSHGNQWGRAPKDKGMIIAPCTNHYECPMYVKGSGVSKGRKDHCHFTQRYIRPPFLQKILGAKDRNHEDVDFSYLSIMRGRDLRDSNEQSIVQGDVATLAAFTGYENPEAALAASVAAQEQLREERELDPTAPAIPDVNDIFGPSSLTNELGEPNSLSLPRAVMPPMKRQGHVILDVCTPSGTLERWTVPKSFSKQAYRDARKAAWGDLWALGAKTRTLRNVRIGRGKEELGGVDSKKGALDVKGKSRRTKEASTKGGKNVIEVGYNADGVIKEEDIRVKNGGRMRTGKIKGIRDKRDKKGLGNGRRKSMVGDE